MMFNTFFWHATKFTCYYFHESPSTDLRTSHPNPSTLHSRPWGLAAAVSDVRS